MMLSEDWLYVRIYTGFNTADHWLTSVLYPLSREMIMAEVADRWFFIRYADPDFHLRYRIRIRDKVKALEYIERLNNSLDKGMKSMLIWKYECGNYVPEKGRYGLNAMEFAECIFQQDSEAVVKFINSGCEIRDDNSRWLYALASMNTLLEDFGFTLPEKKDLLLHLNRSFGQEFGKDKHLANQLSERYRKHRIIINSILDGDAVTGDYRRMNDILAARSKASCEFIKRIDELYKSGRMEVTREDLPGSLIHMTMNRIFKNNNRLHEMVLYDFLFRYYKSATLNKAP